MPSCAGARVSPRAFISVGPKEFLEAGKRRLADDMARAATSTDVMDLRREARKPKEVLAEQVWNRIPSDIRGRIVRLDLDEPEP